MENAPSKLKAVRLRRGLTQESLSAISGVPQESISHMERRTHAVIIKALRLARALGCTVEDLYAEAAARTDVRVRQRERTASVTANP